MSNLYLQAVAPLQMPSSRKFLLFVLADMAGDDGMSYASIAHLIERTCLAERAVQMGLSYLEELGVLERDFRRGRSTHYRLTDPARWKDLFPTATPACGAPPQEMHPRTTCATTPAPSAPAPACGAPTPAPRAPITILEPSLNQREKEEKKTRARRGRAEVVVPDPPDWLDAKAWVSWCEYRAKLKGFTTLALELCLKTLAKHRRNGHDPVLLIELAIERGWQGLYTSEQTLAVVPTSQPMTRREQLQQQLARARTAAERRELNAQLHALGDTDGDAIEGQFELIPTRPGHVPRDARSEDEKLAEVQAAIERQRQRKAAAANP